jgi:homoserine kinase
VKSDAVIRVEAMNALIAALGEVDAERFISMINRDRFDYTEWRRDNLCKGMTFDEVYEEAAAYERDNVRPQA